MEDQPTLTPLAPLQREMIFSLLQLTLAGEDQWWVSVGGILWGLSRGEMERVGGLMDAFEYQRGMGLEKEAWEVGVC